MAIAYVCVDPTHTAARKAAWEAHLAFGTESTNDLQLQDFAHHWEELFPWPEHPRDVKWTTDLTKPGSVASISLKVAMPSEFPSE
jgi:hypothetical protein